VAFLFFGKNHGISKLQNKNLLPADYMKRTCLRINPNTNENSKHGVPSDLNQKIIYG